MKQTVFLLAFALFICLMPAAIAQAILNAGFETPQSAERLLPDNWGVRQQTGFSVQLDSTVAKTGVRSLNISSVVTDPTGFQGFSQRVSVQVDRPSIIHLRASVKTANWNNVALWCQSWDTSKMIGFANSEMQANVPDGPGEWRDLNLILTVLPETKAFVFGGYLKGNGSAWFDDIRFDAITASAGKPSPAVRTYLNKAISLVKKHALVRDSIPWKETEATMFSLATGMQSEAEAHTVVAYLLNVMRRHGDNHSHFQRPVSVKNLYADKPAEDAPKPEGRYLGEGVGYVAVPRFWGVNSARETEFTEAIQRIIQSVDTAQATVGWVVDLRKNQGGNMWPMIAGLRPLIGEGTLGYFVSGKREQPWTYKSAAPKSYTLRHNPTRIAVLIGPQTASSGEMTALSFIGLPTVRTFGLKSGGYTTANQSFTLPDGAELYLAVSGSADRTKKTYPHGIVPDEEVKADSQGTTDATLAAAKAWLTSSK